MPYQLLTEPLVPAALKYRGIYRAPPGYRSDLPEHSQYNTAWRQLASYGEEAIDSREAALSLADQMDPSIAAIDAVWYGPQDSGPENDVRLGYDVAAWEHYSLLGGWIQDPSVISGTDARATLMRLIQDAYRAKLNRYDLFEMYEDAIGFQAALIALQTLIPDVWEADHDPQVIQLRAARLANRRTVDA